MSFVKVIKKMDLSEIMNDSYKSLLGGNTWTANWELTSSCKISIFGDSFSEAWTQRYAFLVFEVLNLPVCSSQLVVVLSFHLWPWKSSYGKPRGKKMQRSLKMSICKILVAVQIHWTTCRRLLPLIFPASFKWTNFVSSFFWYQFLILISLKVSLWFSETNKGNQSSLNLQISTKNKLSWTFTAWIQCSCFYWYYKVSKFLINIKLLSVQYRLLPLPHQYCYLRFKIVFLYFCLL